MKNACYGRIIETEAIRVKIQNSLQKKKMPMTQGKRLKRNWLSGGFLKWKCPKFPDYNVFQPSLELTLSKEFGILLLSLLLMVFLRTSLYSECPHLICDICNKCSKSGRWDSPKQPNPYTNGTSSLQGEGCTETCQQNPYQNYYFEALYALGRAINVTLDRENGTIEDVYDGRTLIRGTGRTVYRTLIIAYES